MPYNYSSTSTGQGNWNTGGRPTGTGSFDRGIVGNSNPRYDYAPSNPQYRGTWDRAIAERNAQQSGDTGRGGSRSPTSASPIARVPTRRNPWSMGILQQLLKGAYSQGLVPSKTRGLGILDQLFSSQGVGTKQDYSRLPEYDRVGGYGDQQWNPPNPQWTSDPSLRNKEFVSSGLRPY